MKSWFLALVLLTITGGLIAAAFFLQKKQQENQGPERLGQATLDLSITERSGQTVQLGDLNGKVRVVACLYTVCPHGCAAVLKEMQSLNTAFGKNPDFHQISLSVAPDRDTPAFLQSFAEGVGVAATDHWWFVTGDYPTTIAFFTKQLFLKEPVPIPEDERVNPLETHEHDLRIVLIDRSGEIRGYYEVFHPIPEKSRFYAAQLHQDTRWCLEHPGK